MPNCFQLYRKGESTPTALQMVDEHICKHFDSPVDAEHWICGWYHVIGFLIATRDGCPLGSRALRLAVVTWYVDDDYRMNQNLTRTRKELRNMIQILKFLEAHYTSNAWVESRR